MEINITDLSYDGKWYDFGDAEFKIRPFPQSEDFIAIEDGQPGITGKKQFKRFKYCLEDWKKVVGKDGKPLSCTDETKQLVFDFNIGGIPSFVLTKSYELTQQKERAEKNSSSGPRGSSQKTP